MLAKAEIAAFLNAHYNRIVSNDFVSALIQALFIFVISNSPYLVLVFLHFCTTKSDASYLVQALDTINLNWKPSDIFILVSTLLAPFTYVMYSYHRHRRHMPFFFVFLGILVCIYGGSSLIFALNRLGHDLNQEFVKGSALVCYFCALLIWYTSMVYQRKLKVPQDVSVGKPDKMATELAKEI